MGSSTRRLSAVLVATFSVAVAAPIGCGGNDDSGSGGAGGGGGRAGSGSGGSVGGGGAAGAANGGGGGAGTSGGVGGGPGGASGTAGGGGTSGAAGMAGAAGGEGGQAGAGAGGAPVDAGTEAGGGGMGGASSGDGGMAGAGGGGGPLGSDPGPGWTMRWGGTAMSPGMDLFEGQETSECSHGGVAHASIAGGKIRIDSHYPVDTDCNGRTDRARNEVKGMRAPGGGYVSMRQGETWLIQYDMFIPDTLDATTQFSHIYQIFSVSGTSAVTGPVVTMTLHSHADVDSIELRIDGNSGPHFSPVPLAPIQNRWVTVEHEMRWAGNGYYRWSIKDGDRVHVNAMRPAWNGWHGAERMRPKWGIYRNKGSAGLQTTHLLLDNFRAYQKM